MGQGVRLFDLAAKECPNPLQAGERLSPPGELVHLWLFAPQGAREWLAEPRVLAWLGLEEQTRLGNIRHPDSWLEFGAGRLLLRWLLSRYRPEVTPAEWRIEISPSGKPSLAAPQRQGWEFNLSHGGGFLAIVFALHRRIGVDVEGCLSMPDQGRIARRIFHPDEVVQWEQTPAGRARNRLFYRFWCLREAYGKALGCGLDLAPDACFFDLSRKGSIGFSIAQPGGWKFYDFSPRRECRLALCVEA